MQRKFLRVVHESDDVNDSHVISSELYSIARSMRRLSEYLEIGKIDGDNQINVAFLSMMKSYVDLFRFHCSAVMGDLDETKSPPRQSSGERSGCPGPGESGASPATHVDPIGPKHE